MFYLRRSFDITGKEWVQNELSLDWDCLTTYDRMMLNKVLKELNRLEKLEKVVKVVKEKRVNVDFLLNSSDYCVYNFYAKKEDLEVLSQEEYELLKEMLSK